MNHLNKYHCYLPPVHKPNLLPDSLKHAEKEWERIRQKKPSLASIFWLLGAKNPQVWKNTLLSHWLHHYCLRDSEWIFLFFAYFSKNKVFHKLFKKVPKQIILWNDIQTRTFSLETTIRWNTADQVTDKKRQINVKKSWKSFDQSAEGFIQQWGSVPEWNALPIRFPFYLATEWPLPWQMLFRSLIFSFCYPQQSILSIRPWNGWSWIYRWLQWCIKNLGKIQTNHIYPECTPNDPIPSNHIHIGLDIGWYLLEYFAKNKNELEKYKMIHHQLFTEDNKFSENSYLFMDFVTNQIFQNDTNVNINLKNAIRSNWQQDMQLFIYLPALWHSYATQDRSSEDIVNEFEKITSKMVLEKKKTKQEESTVLENETPKETIFDWYIPQKDDHPIQNIQKEKADELRLINMTNSHSNTDNSDNSDFDFDELDKWMSTRK
jgi:hypothetical protein